MTNYYQDQLQAVTATHDPKFPFQVKITNGFGDSTKWLALNEESAKSLVDWLRNTFPGLEDSQPE